MRYLYIILLLSVHYISFGQCEANFVVTQNGNEFQFTNISNIPNGDEVTSNLWKFGDGSTSIELNPSHNYLLPGLYDVSLQIATSSGCNDEVIMQVEICQVSLDFNLSSVCDDNDNVSLIISVNDVFNNLDSVTVYLDEELVGLGTYDISSGSMDIQTTVLGDGGQHTIRVESEPNGFCSETLGFLVQNCNASCFLSDLVIDEGFQEEHNIALLDDGFNPKNREVLLGDKIRFLWLSDNHTSTSVDTLSIDQWDSGVQDSSYILELTPKNPGLKSYYSSVDGGVEGEYTGNIIANCPDNRGSTIGIKFFNTQTPETGFYVGIDGVIIKDTIYSYSPVGLTSISFFLTGDGKAHQISIIDAEDQSCVLRQTIRAINCAGDFSCSMNIDARIIDRCNVDSMVTVGIDINTLAPTDQGVSIILDDSLVMDTIYFVDKTASTSVVIFGDGNFHTIRAIDLSDLQCRDEVDILVNDCSESCSIENLEIGTGSNNTFVLPLTKGSVNPGDIVISAGDDILWQWIQDSLIAVRSVADQGINSWDSGFKSDGDIFLSPILSAGIHPYYLYNQFDSIVFEGIIEVLASCDEDKIPVIFNFSDVNGSPDGYDIYIDSVKVESGPYQYTLDGNNRGVFQLFGDDEEHLIEIRDRSESSCFASDVFLAPSCFVEPCGGKVELLTLDSCFNNNTINYVATVSHPNPTNQGFILTINGQLLEGFPFFYGPDSTTTFNGSLFADSSIYTFNYVDLDDPECKDTLVFQSPLCVTDCELSFQSIQLLDSTYLANNPETPDSLIGCIDSFINVSIIFNEKYSNTNSYIVSVDGVQNGVFYPYNNGDGLNEVLVNVFGNDEEHLITVTDASDANCSFTTSIFTPLCYSACNVAINELLSDSCSNELGHYTLLLDSLNNRTDFLVYYDGDSLDVDIDSLGFNMSTTADGLEHTLLLVDRDETLCRDSIEFTASYCLQCPLEVSLMQLDSCVIEDSIGYAIVFDESIDSISVLVDYRDSAFTLTPYEIEYEYMTRLRGDSASHTYVFTSSVDKFCMDTLTIQTIDCTPIICEADFGYSIDGLTITFIDSSVTSEPLIDQSWTINDIIEVGNLATFNYTVDSIGAYNVCHTITTDSCMTTACQNIVVGDPCTLVNSLFSAVRVGDGFQFTNESTGEIDNYLYRFGDGIFSNNENPFHVYDQSGSYEVCLTVTQEEFACEKEYCQTIDIVLSDNDLELDTYVSIYPNPLSQHTTELNINYNGKTVLKTQMITLRNTSGQFIDFRSLEMADRNNYRLHLKEGLAKGLYMVTFEVNNKLMTRRILIL